MKKKKINLIYHSRDRRDKYCTLIDNGDGTLTAIWEVGGLSDSKTYPISRLNAIYMDKLNKGYKDITKQAS